MHKQPFYLVLQLYLGEQNPRPTYTPQSSQPKPSFVDLKQFLSQSGGRDTAGLGPEETAPLAGDLPPQQSRVHTMLQL